MCKQLYLNFVQLFRTGLQRLGEIEGGRMPIPECNQIKNENLWLRPY